MAAIKSSRKLPFDIKEYRQRLARVRKNMEKAGADVMLVTAPENIYYLLGYHTVGYFSFQVLIVALDRDPIMLARGLNTTQVEND
ncbi:MAG: aminopeptidase P family N-terminal domain-containing protein, partial [Proteobacteria bacterium]|nr:aminopeptidase P family N-terminal domain-containing protein [Pseudomonadota bacterium]